MADQAPKPKKRKELTPEDVGKLIDEGHILNEPGADWLTRWLIKMFAANPQEAMGFLERRGFEVMETDRLGKLQFAIRHKELAAAAKAAGEKKSPHLKWRVLDKEGGIEMADAAEMAFDIFIAGPMIAFGGATGAAVPTVAGQLGPQVLTPEELATVPVGAAVGMGLGGAGSEALRQAIGGALGVNVNTDIRQVGMAGTLATVLPGLAQRVMRFPRGLLRGTKWAGKKTADVTRGLAGKVAGAAPEEMILASESKVRTRRLLSGRVAQETELLDKFRGFLGRMSKPENRFPESREIDSIIEHADSVPVQRVFRFLKQENVQPVGEQRIGLRQIKQIGKDITEKYGLGQFADTPDARVSAKTAQKIQDDLQDAIDWSGRPGQSFKNKQLKKAQHEVGVLVERAIKNPKARARYRKINGNPGDVDLKTDRYVPGTGVRGKMDVINYLNTKMGKHKKTGTSETFFENLTKHGKNQDKRVVEDLDRLFGTDFGEEGLVVRLGLKFAGPGASVPRLTATGNILGAGLAGGGFATQGIPGMLTGAGIAATTLTPRGMVRGARAVTIAEKGVEKLTRQLLPDMPLQTFLGRATGGAGVGETSRVILDPDPRLPKRVRDAAAKIASAVDLIPGLTTEQKMKEFKKRSAGLLKEPSPKPAQ